ncbi:MAG: hypothetical protein M3426_04080 [Actinomycetota bacterium]|nr:hypothetical protein [Actinomycetota bacterium]
MLESGHLDFAAPRAYYGGCFYVAEALLLDEGSSFSRHGSLIGEYGRLFVKTGRLDRRFHRLLIRSFTARSHGGPCQTYRGQRGGERHPERHA